ncbi:MAG TPA: radical SAM protein [Desulfatirhabdiaceae bacterium]|nr:radical SAM protein [Desulfatirhabdiaceae bacterium]
MIRESSFEQGPIRPPNEARSFLLRVTRNCPWNQCLFCPVYKHREFSLRSVAEIKTDIQTARDMADDIHALSIQLGSNGNVDDRVVSHITGTRGTSDCYRGMALWMYYGTGACFLQDADNLIMKTDDLVDVLTFLRQKFPEIKRITTYSRSKTVARKSIESLKRIREAGLNRVHIGLESGCDAVLKLMKKGVTAAVHVEAGQKLVSAGMEVSEYVMPGLGGQALWREHAIETAQTLNRINPDFIRLRSLRVPSRVPLFEKLENGSFIMQTDDAVVEEIRLFIETLDGIQSTVTSDHIMNLLETVAGKLPEDKDRMLDVIRSYQSLSESDRMIYRVGRRGGVYRSPADLKADGATYSRIRSLIQEVESTGGKDGVDRFITEMVDQYI